MKYSLFILLLAGCAITPGAAVESQTELAVPAAVPVDDKPKEPEAKPKKAIPPKPPPEKTEKKEATSPKVLPPCESVPGDKRTALMQKMDCLLETADKPLPKTDKPPTK